MPRSTFDEPTNAATNGVAGLVVDLVGRSDLLDAAVVHDDDLVGELERLLLVVRDEQAGHAQLAVEVVEPGSQLLPDAGVQRAERLVEKQHLGRGASARASATRWRCPPDS